MMFSGSDGRLLLAQARGEAEKLVLDIEAARAGAPDLGSGAAALDLSLFRALVHATAARDRLAEACTMWPSRPESEPDLSFWPDGLEAPVSKRLSA